MELYDNVMSSALKLTSGNMREADYVIDCSYFEYYYRIAMLNQYGEWMEKQMKK